MHCISELPSQSLPDIFSEDKKNKDKVLGERKQKLQTTKNTQAGLCEPPAPFSEFHA